MTGFYLTSVQFVMGARAEHEKVIKNPRALFDKCPFLVLILHPDVKFRTRKIYKLCYMTAWLPNTRKLHCDHSSYYMIQ